MFSLKNGKLGIKVCNKRRGGKEVQLSLGRKRTAGVGCSENNLSREGGRGGPARCLALRRVQQQQQSGGTEQQQQQWRRTGSVALGGATSWPEAVRGGGSVSWSKNCYSVTSSEEGGGKGEEGRGRASLPAQLQKKGGSLLSSSSSSGAKGGRKDEWPNFQPRATCRSQDSVLKARQGRTYLWSSDGSHLWIRGYPSISLCSC